MRMMITTSAIRRAIIRRPHSSVCLSVPYVIARQVKSSAHRNTVTFKPPAVTKCEFSCSRVASFHTASSLIRLTEYDDSEAAG